MHPRLVFVVFVLSVFDSLASAEEMSVTSRKNGKCDIWGGWVGENKSTSSTNFKKRRLLLGTEATEPECGEDRGGERQGSLSDMCADPEEEDETATGHGTK